ncbi:MAG: putative glycoside hydrolase [bacterium]|nr:putative glycoside hydrolase [bacterium]
MADDGTKMNRQSVKAYRTGAGLVTVFVFAFVGLYIGIPSHSDMRYEANGMGTSSAAQIDVVEASEPEGRKATYVATPDAVRGIYMTSCVAGSKSLRDNLVKLVDETELNTIVIDVKSYDGRITFDTGADILQPAEGGGCFVKDMQDFIDELHAKGIYVIARLAVFQDTFMVKEKPEWAVKTQTSTTTVWRDHKGIPWIDASAKPYWDYMVMLARETHAIGVDEIQFDYIRFPSDGNMKDIWYPWSGTNPKAEIMREFFSYLHEKLSPEGIVISADLFGMTTTNTDDLNIGQVLEYALPYFDYISPMVYPSHYPNNFYNLGDPNKNVYQVIKVSMDKAVARTIATTTTVVFPDARIGTSTPALYAKPSFDPKKLRPWLQDNNYPVPYTAEMVRAQIQATYDTGLDSWLLWNAGNRYTRAALLTDGQ